MTSESAELLDGIRAAVRNHLEGLTEISNLRRLSGGASKETWTFEAAGDTGASVPLVLRRMPGGMESTVEPGKFRLETEAKLLRLAKDAGVPVPGVRHVATPEDGIGTGFIMDFIEGETIARKILRDDAYAEARPKMARQSGEILARIHAIPTDDLDELETSDGIGQLNHYRTMYDNYDYPHPVFETAFRWLKDRMQPCHQPCFVHGDFRHGNLIVDSSGVRAVLDWELAHLGDPMEDLSWICVPSWRYGVIDKPVGGFGEREDLFAGYEAAGGEPVDPDSVKTWEVFGAMKWGIMCMSMYSVYSSGSDRTVERAAIARRSSETEIDLLRLLYQE